MKTIPQLFDHLSKSVPDQVALIDRKEATTYSELVFRSRQLATGLREQGIVKGDRVGLWLPNIAAYLEMFLACAEIGAIVVSVNTKFKSFEVADIVSRSGCKMLVLWPAFKNIPFLEILSDIPVNGLAELETVVLYGENGEPQPELPVSLSGKQTCRFNDLYKSAVVAGVPAVSEEDGLVVFTTSGTTGKPKFVLHSQRSVTVHALEVAENFGYAGRECRMLQAIPLCGTFGLAQFLAGLAAKAEIYCMPVFDPVEGCNLIKAHRITDMNGSDDMFAMLLDQTDEEKPFPYLKQGGFAAFNPGLGDIAERAHKRGIKLMGLWGMSEVQALFAHQNPESSVEQRKRAGGYLVSPGAEVRITDPDTGEILSFGSQGEIEVRAPSQMKEYLGNPEATRKTITADGFIKTGDLGFQEEPDSFIFISRMGDVLRLGGFLTDPMEIETCLQEADNVVQAQVVGVDTSRGTKAFAFVQCHKHENFNEKQLMGFCKAKLANYKIPVGIVVVDDFPMTESANGFKIQRSKLREMALKAWQNRSTE